ncbi:MAG: dihydrolipoyl dehydrogenase [Bacilli bacterium]
MQTFDLVIVGGGPGGYVAAIKAGQLGLKVALIEKDNVGGVCLNWGCIPTKTLLKSAKVFEQFKHAKDYGIDVKPDSIAANLPEMIKRKDSVVRRLTGGVGSLLKKAGVTVIKGMGEVLDANHVKVSEETLEAKNLILATGASVIMPPIPGLQEAFDAGFLLTSKEILDLKTLPASLVIVGGGVIGLEFATIFNSLGTKVTVIERLPNILAQVDEELRNLFQKKITKDGIQLITSATVTKIGTNAVSYELDGKTIEINTDKVLMAVGMKPNTKSFASLNLAMEKHGVQVNEYMQTSIPNVYAIGDVTGKFMLAHVASHAGLVVIDHLQGGSQKMDYHAIPSGIYTFPEIAMVGVTEQDAKAQGIDYQTATFPLAANGKAMGENEKDGLVKIIVSKPYKEIIGVHIMGPSATELITEATLAINLEATAEELVHTIHPHPTLSEMVMEAAHGIIDKPIHI